MSIPAREQLDIMEAHALMGLLNDVLVQSEAIKVKMDGLHTLKQEKIQEHADARVALLRDKKDLEANSRLIQAKATLDILKVEIEKQKSLADACKLQSSILQTSINTQVRLAR